MATCTEDAPDPRSPATVAVTAGRPRHEPDAPLNAPLTMASTYVAGGDLEYGRYGNPTWAAFEEALGALEGGRCLSFASGLAAVATVLDLVGQGGMVVAPRHAYNGTLMQLGRPRGPRPADAPAGRRHRHRRGGRRRATDAALVWLESPTNPALEVADIPTDPRGRPRRRRLRRRRQHLRHSPAAAAARASAPTSSCTRRRSTSPATATCCSAPSSPATTSCTTS